MHKAKQVVFLLLLIFFSGVLQAQEDFSQWLSELKVEALQKGVSNKIFY